jgi:hypothetical protein
MSALCQAFWGVFTSKNHALGASLVSRFTVFLCFYRDFCDFLCT